MFPCFLQRPTSCSHHCSKGKPVSLESNSAAHILPSTVWLWVKVTRNLKHFLNLNGFVPCAVPTGGHAFPSIALHSSSVPSNPKEIQEGTSPGGIRLSLHILCGLGGVGREHEDPYFFLVHFFQSKPFQSNEFCRSPVTTTTVLCRHF